MSNTRPPLKSFLGFSPEFLMRQNFFSAVLRKLRRTIYAKFHKEYVVQGIEARKGDCNRCGACCELVLKCPMLARDSQNMPYCRVYGTVQPQSCKNYPFDEIDRDVPDCTFSFEDNKKK